MTRRGRVRAAAAFIAAALAGAVGGQQGTLGDDARVALRRAVEFYRPKVATHGGYHFSYTNDLSYGRSEQSETPNRVEVQREGTPVVGMAYLDAYEATGDRYYLEAAREVAETLVRGQLCSGGWDYFIDFTAAERSRIGYRADTGCAGPAAGRNPGVTTLDDNVTQANLRLLMRVDQELGFNDAKIHASAVFALESLMKAQYPNGAWPQRYSRFPEAKDFPVVRASYPESYAKVYPGADYRGHYTFNDNSIVDTIDMFLEAARIYGEEKYQEAAERGGGFILLAQMPEPQPGWAQQYDKEMHPAWARRFEPPGVTGGESQGVMQMLLVLYRETGNRKYLEPMRRALAYYRRSLLPPEENPSEIRRRQCPGDTPCLARFYELRTNRPLYITKGTRVQVLDGTTTLVGGYELSYSDTSVIGHYSVVVPGRWVAAMERSLNEVEAADAKTLRRPKRLRGLSPWSGEVERTGASEERVRQVIASLDQRGAWVEDGVIGKANRIVSVLAANEMVLKIGGKSYPIHENDTIELFPGKEQPQEKIIRSSTFARNVGALAGYLRRLK
ncbi:MAG: hypothetical protein HZB13_15805 [Acidobacteria bacterium]|nr:hypothetical protein [Acidobacteriota bacterium]